MGYFDLSIISGARLRKTGPFVVRHQWQPGVELASTQNV